MMTLPAGELLSSRLRRGDRFTSLDTKLIGAQIADALQTARERGIAHRDLEPDNVYLVPDSTIPGGVRPKILHIGIARIHYGGARRVEHRNAVHALGCILYQMVTGRKPFAPEDRLRSRPTPPSAIVSDVDPALESAILRCLKRSPAARFASMRELSEALLPYQERFALIAASREALARAVETPLAEQKNLFIYDRSWLTRLMNKLLRRPRTSA
jgi:serine/threonine-protein kinase